MKLQKNINYLVGREKDAQTVAREIKVSPNTISLLRKQSGYDPKISTLIKIAKYFNVTLDDLVFKDLSKQKPDTS